MALCIEWDNTNKQTELTVIINTVPAETHSERIDTLIIDEPIFDHILGAEQDELDIETTLPKLSNLYQGFIYEFCYYNHKQATFLQDQDFRLGECNEYPSCNVCPVEVCLIDCNWN
jgi:hypothetical protein